MRKLNVLDTISHAPCIYKCTSVAFPNVHYTWPAQTVLKYVALLLPPNVHSWSLVNIITVVVLLLLLLLLNTASGGSKLLLIPLSRLMHSLGMSTSRHIHRHPLLGLCRWIVDLCTPYPWRISVGGSSSYLGWRMSPFAPWHLNKPAFVLLIR